MIYSERKNELTEEKKKFKTNYCPRMLDERKKLKCENKKFKPKEKRKKILNLSKAKPNWFNNLIKKSKQFKQQKTKNPEQCTYLNENNKRF